MLSVRLEGKSVKIEISCLFVHSFEGMSDADVDPDSNIVGADVKGSVVKLDCFISSA